MIINDQELEGFCRDRYFARALRLTTKEKGWWKTPILLLLACFVPIVGPLGAIGYVGIIRDFKAIRLELLSQLQAAGERLS